FARRAGVLEWQRPPHVDALALGKASIAAAHVLEARWHHADDRERPPAQTYLPAKQVRIGLEPATPQCLAEHDDAGVAALFGPGEPAAERRAHAQHAEIVRRHLQPAERFRTILERELQVRAREAGDAVQGAVVVAIGQQRALAYRERGDF